MSKVMHAAGCTGENGKCSCGGFVNGQDIRDALDRVEKITKHARTGPRHGVIEREIKMYDKGYDDALDHVRSVLRLIGVEA